MKKLIVLTNMAAPYRNSFFQHLAKAWDLLVVYNVWSEKNRTWHVDSEVGFSYQVLDTRAKKVARKRKDVAYEESRWRHGGQGVIKVLRSFKPDVIVTLEFGARTLRALTYGSIKRTPVIVWWEGTEHTEAECGLVKKISRKIFSRFLTGAFANGLESRSYLEMQGLHEGQIQIGMTGTDTKNFAFQVDRERENRVSKREILGLDGIVLLFCGRLSTGKGIKQLVEALDLLDESDKAACSVLFVGEGSEREVIEAFSQKPGFPKVHITGFVQPDDLPRYYAMADWFVLPTLDDNWPLVTIEAIAAGLPQIFSKYNGGSADFADHPEFGMLSDPLDPHQLRDCLSQAIRKGAQRLPSHLRQEKIDYYSGEAQARRATEFLNRFV
ncbi:MAG: glycosyltransferase [Luteolibacter sp.]